MNSIAFRGSEKTNKEKKEEEKKTRPQEKHEERTLGHKNMSTFHTPELLFQYLQEGIRQITSGSHSKTMLLGAVYVSFDHISVYEMLK